MNRALLFGFALLATACGNSKTFDSLCANQVPPPEACNTACDPAPGATNACPTGYHCSADGKCDLLCTPNGNECGDGYACTADGYCMKDGDGSNEPPVDSNCPAVHVTATKTTPTVELLIDQSASMSAEYGSEPSRWAAIQKALVDPTNGVVKKLQGSVVFGAALYSNRSHKETVNGEVREVGDKPCPTLTTKPRALNNFTAIQQLLQAGLIEDTPTAESIDAVVADFKSKPPAAGSPPIIVLATDGLPDSCADADPPANSARQDATSAGSVAAAQRAYAAGVKLFFLFVGDDEAGTHPQQMANAGAGLDPATGKAKFYVATNPTDLANAFNDIVGGVLSCDLKLTNQVDPADAPGGTVTINKGAPLTYGTDWTVVDEGKTLRLLGNACTAVKNATAPTVDAEFPCGTVIL